MMRSAASLIFVLLMIVSTAHILADDGPRALPARADPVLSAGGVYCPSPAPVTGNYTFHVNYTDADGDGPWYGEIYVHVDNRSYQLGSSSSSYSTGVNYTRTINGFESGVHSYYFSVLKPNWNGTIVYPAEYWKNPLTFTVPGNYSTPRLKSVMMTPRYAGLDQPVNFTCTYEDVHGHAPNYVQIRFDGGTWKNMTVMGTDYVNGADCFYRTSFSSYSYHYYDLRTQDSTDLNATYGSYSFNIQNGQPEMFDAGVTPPTGDADKTDFTFFTHYKDWEGDAPQYIRVEILKVVNGNYSQNYLNAYLQPTNGPYNTTQYMNGVNYSVTLTLLTADFEYRFIVRSSYYYVYLPANDYYTLNTTGWRHRPYLTDLNFSPKTGDEDTVFNISVRYHDIDNSPPAFVNVTYRNLDLSLSVHGTDHRNGTLCSINTKLPTSKSYFSAYTKDSQNLWSDQIFTNESLIIKGTGELGFLDSAWVTPNPGDASSYTRYYFYVDYHHPVNDTNPLYASEVKLILDNNTYWMNIDEWKSNTTMVYLDRVYNLEAGIHRWHVEGLDYGFREMRYPESGDLTLQVFEDAPNIQRGSITPMHGNDRERFTFNLSVYKEWGNTSIVKEVDAYVVIDDVEHSMTDLGSTSNWTDVVNYQYKGYLSAGTHRILFKAEYEGEGYSTYPDWDPYYTIFVEGHNEILGRNVLPQSPYTDDIMNFTIVYKDTGGYEADYMRIFIDNDVYNMTAAPGNVSLGRTYYFRTRLSEGNHTYWFEAVGRNTTLRSPGIGNYYTVYVREKVVINYPMLINSTVSPSSGDNSTTFDFKVRYKHPEGLAPGHVNIIIDGGSRMMTKGTGNNFTQGVDYSYSTKLTTGVHVYYFHANDSSGREIRFPGSGVYTIEVTDEGTGTYSYPPVAMISYTTGRLSVSLDGTSSYDSDGTITQYYWVVGGSSYTGSRQNITFDDPGYITATLTVIDDDGLSGTTKVSFWVTTSSTGSSSGGNDVGGVIEVTKSGQGSLIETEDGTSISLDEAGENGAYFSFDSNSTDPRVVVLDVSKEAISLSYGEDAKVQIDGVDIEEADSLEDLIGATGDTPLYYIVRSGDSYRVMVYLPDPSDVEDIDVVVTGDTDTSDPEESGSHRDWFLVVMIVISVILALVVILLVLTRRGPSYDGMPEDEEDEYDQDTDLEMISGSKRETYRKFMEE